MLLQRHKDKWWIPTSLPHSPIRMPRNRRNMDPVGYPITQRLTGKVGSFATSNRWAYWNTLTSVDGGYIVPLYDIKAIGKRYGLSLNSQKYFKKYILPEPHDIVRRRSVASHHWSRFTLMALDVVLQDLERLGYRQFLKRFEDHIDNLHEGTSWMEDYYAQKYEERIELSGDKFGVSWE